MNSPLRILYICHEGALYGSQQSLLLILRNLDRQKFQPIVSIARPGPLNKILEEELNIPVLSHKRLQWFKHDRRNLFKRIGDLIALQVNSYIAPWKLARHIQQYDIHLVHTNSVVSLEGPIAAMLARVPHIWHIRELFMEDNPKLNAVLGKRLTRLFIHHLSSRVFCISEAVKAQFKPYLKQYPAKYPRIYNALNLPEEVRSKAGSPVFQIGYVGRLSAGKRFHDLVDAMALIRQETQTSFHLTVAGTFVDMPYEALVKDKIAAHQLEPYITLMGHQADLEPIYQSLDVLVVPSLNEPFGRVVIEAMARQIPCIAAKAGGIPEIIDENKTGYLFAPKDVRTLANILKEAMTAPDKLITMGAHAREAVANRFGVTQQMEHVQACYIRTYRECAITTQIRGTSSASKERTQ
ncbi:MAG: glycosyltransferase family 4 protein [Vampirovibrio sp.]|nr:glycosyltransferase family 4 protein [Vampirovibrio sp.]